jgi:hypothetical protein
MIQQELMTTKEVAAYLRIKERKVYKPTFKGSACPSRFLG